MCPAMLKFSVLFCLKLHSQKYISVIILVWCTLGLWSFQPKHPRQNPPILDWGGCGQQFVALRWPEPTAGTNYRLANCLINVTSDSNNKFTPSASNLKHNNSWTLSVVAGCQGTFHHVPLMKSVGSTPPVSSSAQNLVAVKNGIHSPPPPEKSYH